MSKHTYYVPTVVETEAKVTVTLSDPDDETKVYEQDGNISLCWADGMVGAIPVFDSHEAAKAYGGEDVEVYKLADFDDAGDDDVEEHY
jgi:hypothetical protein